MSYEKLPLKPFFDKVESLKKDFIERLRKAVEIPSISGEDDRRAQVVEMAHFLIGEMEKLGFEDIQTKDLGYQKTDLKLPPIVLGRYGNDSSKKTVLVYGHYDVQPASKEDGWNTEPFKFFYDEKKDALFGRGATDDKGPVVGWLNAIEAHRQLGWELPVNLVVCFEGMEESGSEGLDGLVAKEADLYFKTVDTVCISDNYWLGTKKPVLTYGLRGVSYYKIEVEGPSADLHSGLFGGVVAEPMTDLVRLMAELVDSQGNILIKGVNEMVAPVTKKEESLYDDVEFSVGDLDAATGSKTSLYQDKKDILMHRWRFPSLSLHGIEGGFSGAGAKTVIPAKVVGKFSIRTVPDIDARKLDEYVSKYVEKKFAQLKSPNKVRVSLIHDGDYWISDPLNASFSAAAKATEDIWNVTPDFTREGGSIPITLTFEKELKTDVLLLPMGRGDDGAHSINEKIDVSNYVNGIKTLGAFLHYYSKS